MRAPTIEDVQQSIATGRWTTAAQNLNSAFRNGDFVLLLFAVHRENMFAGYGRMVSEAVPVAGKYVGLHTLLGRCRMHETH